jgi:cobalt-zinc-cadmium efflux system membrane fusion protein
MRVFKQIKDDNFIFLLSILTFFLLSSACLAEEHGGEDDHHETKGDSHAGHEDEKIFEFSWEKAEEEGVTVAKAGPAMLHHKLKLYGEVALNGDSIVHVVPRFPGTLQKVTKHLGESVKAGDLLAIVQSNESLTPYEIRAEIDGTVIDKDATRGEFVSNDKELFVIANLDNIWINVAIPSQSISKIHVGTSVNVISESMSINERAQIDYVRPILSEETRTALARIILDNQEAKWSPGMFVSIEALADPQEVLLAVPAESIVLIENKATTFLRAKSEDGDQGFEVRQVKVGKSDGRMTEILDGLEAGEDVASGETFILKAQLGKGAAEHSH